MERTDRIKAYLALNLACLLWAGNIVVGRALSGLVGTWTIVTGRALLSSLLFLLLLRAVGRRSEPGLASDWRPLLFMALTGIAGYQAALYYGVRGTTAINASLIHAAAPLVTIAFAAVLIKTRVNQWQWAGACCSLAGIGFLMGRGAWWAQVTDINSGDLFILLAMVLWALFSIVGQRVMEQRSVLSTTTWATLLSLPLVVPFGAIELSGSTATISPWAWLGIAYTAVGAGVLAFLCWNHGVRKLGAAPAMIFINLSPVYCVLLATLFLGEQLWWYHGFGAVLVLGGCFLALRPATVASPEARASVSRQAPGSPPDKQER